MLWACILLPQLALDSVLRRRPPSDEPLALIGGNAASRILLAVNASARAAGLRAGQKLTAAHALLHRFDTVEHNPDHTAQQHRWLAAFAYRYSAEVALLPHAIVLEVSHSFSLFGPWPVLQAHLRDELVQLQFRHRITLAPTAQAAYVLAGIRDGLAVTTTEALPSMLAGIPVEKARLPEGHAAALAGMGLRTLGSVLRAPRDGLRRRFGHALLQQLDHLTGNAPDVLPLFRPADRLTLAMEWPHEIAHVEALQFPLRRLIGDLAVYLAGRDGGVQHFVVRLLHHNGSHTDVTVGLLTPERNAAMLFEHARARLERTALPDTVIGLRLIADELPPFVPAGRDLFDTRPANALPLTQLHERLRARLGDHAVQQWRATTDPRPEHAQTTTPGPSAEVPSLPRPTWLLDAPVPWPGPPPRILAGPERLETGWWDGGDLRRDYYVVETAQGQRAWMFDNAGHTGQWMLHGWFA